MDTAKKKFGNVEVTYDNSFPSFIMNGCTYHFNFKRDGESKHGIIYHLTLEDDGTNSKKFHKLHYFFANDNGTISNAVAPKEFQNRYSKKLSDAPTQVRQFVEAYAGEVLSWDGN
ncbi:MAG: hypothetical protein AAFQ98_17875 [Bacteroidota bacterium]